MIRRLFIPKKFENMVYTQPLLSLLLTLRKKTDTQAGCEGKLLQDAPRETDKELPFGALVSLPLAVASASIFLRKVSLSMSQLFRCFEYIFPIVSIFAMTTLTGDPILNSGPPSSAKQFSFTPPKGWECLNNKAELPAKIEIVYIGQGKKGFTPSINLATEETLMNLADYVGLAKSYHESHPQTICQCVGEIKTEAGLATVLQIDRKTAFGDVRFLQGMVIVDNRAYVMTATCLHEDFALYGNAFVNAIKTLTIQNEKLHVGGA